MEWPKILESLIGSSPLAALLALGLRVVWNRSERRDQESAAREAAMAKQLADSQDARIADLKSMLKPEP